MPAQLLTWVRILPRRSSAFAATQVWVNPNAGRENVVKECVLGEVLYAQLLNEVITKYATVRRRCHSLSPLPIRALIASSLPLARVVGAR